MKIWKYKLEITVFISGAVIMIFELVWSRILWPYFWTSIFIWTSLIGIILWSLSLGYYIWWKMSDKNPSYNTLSMIIFLSAISIWIILVVKWFLLSFLQKNLIDIRIMSTLASIILFLPTSVLLGMVFPFAAKLKLNSLDDSWKTIGNLNAVSTTWSILWTFLAWFYLIPHFWTNNLLVIISIILIFLCIFVYFWNKKLKVFSLIAFIFTLYSVSEINLSYEKNWFIDIDTAYNRVWIYDFTDLETWKTAKVMWINNENHSSMFLDSDELVNDYTKYYHLAKHFNPDFKKTLMLWWAWYSYPKDFLSRYSESIIDVIEIDPKITELAKKYFRLKDNPRLTTYHEDGRAYLNKTEKKYDVIFWDAFSSHYSLPYQLTTKEAIQKKYDILNEDGVVVLNIISSVEWKTGKFLRAEYFTYKSIFPQVYIFPVRKPENWTEVQNIILVALKSDKKYSFNSSDKELNGYLEHLWKKDIPNDLPLITDDFAPVDYYISEII